MTTKELEEHKRLRDKYHKLRVVIVELRDYLYEHEDIQDGPNGPQANWAMRVNMHLNTLLDKHEVSDYFFTRLKEKDETKNTQM